MQYRRAFRYQTDWSNPPGGVMPISCLLKHNPRTEVVSHLALLSQSLLGVQGKHCPYQLHLPPSSWDWWWGTHPVVFCCFIATGCAIFYVFISVDWFDNLEGSIWLGCCSPSVYHDWASWLINFDNFFYEWASSRVEVGKCVAEVL